MDEMQQKLDAILGNPEMMSQLMSMAQSLGSPPREEPPPSISTTPSLDPAMLQRIAQIVGNTGIDNRQQMLLKALSPYLSAHRLEKLEKAMRAAKLAGLATTLLGSGMLSIGR